MALLATLEGDYYSPIRPQRRNRNYYHRQEMMGGFWDAIRGIGRGAVRTVTAAGKGIGHTFAEAGRGISRGDIGRVLKSPFKGAGHIVGETYRGSRDAAQWFWRPSKMRQWMAPMGKGVLAAAPFTGPFAPILLGTGAALTIGGTVGETIYNAKKQGVDISEEEARAYMAQAKRKNTWLWAGAGALALGALVFFA